MTPWLNPDMPSAAGSGNYRASPAPSPTGGGVLAPGQAQGFDDGGVIPTDDDVGESDGTDQDQGAESATMNPMSMIQSALAHGRQKMGQPAKFYPDDTQGDTQAFEEGGEVQDDTQDQGDSGVIPDGAQPQPQQQPTPGTPDPRSTVAYLTGAGGVRPEVAAAMESRVDPQGQMTEAQRKWGAIQAAPDDASRFGLMQYYRQLYNSHAGAAKAAMKQGNMQLAAGHMTKAMSNVPTGHEVAFMPGQGGLVTQSRPMSGGQQQQPEPQPQEQPSYEDGGEVEEDGGRQPGQDNFLPDQEESTNVEDRRGEGKDNWRDFKRAAGNVGSAISSGFYNRRKQLLGFDEGGEVPDDEPAPDQGGGPQTIDPSQAEAILSAGYDKPAEKGWLQTLTEALGSLGNPKENPDDDLKFADTDLGKKLVPKPMPGVSNDPAELPASPDNPGAPAGAPGQVPIPQPRPPEAGAGGKGDRLDAAPDATTVRDKSKPLWKSPSDYPDKPKPAPKPGDPDDFEKKVRGQANRMYPWMSQQGQVSDFMSHNLTEHNKSGANDRAAASNESRERIARERNESSERRNENSVGQRRDGGGERENRLDARAMSGKFERALRQERANGVDVDKSIENVAKLYGTTPDVVRRATTLNKGSQQEGGEAQPQQRVDNSQAPRYSMPAVQYLVQNPNTAQAFNSKYGPGAAEKVLAAYAHGR